MAANTRKKAKAKKAAKKAGAGQDKLYTAQVRELVGLMIENDLTSLEIVNGDLKVSLGRGGPQAAVDAATVMPPAAVAPAAVVEAAAPKVDDDLIDIVSPMVGTFYASPSPDSDVFVGVGDRIGSETVVCIIEAMKVMNEIKAECSGAIAELVVTNGQPVEYGQVLFRVKP